MFKQLLRTSIVTLALTGVFLLVLPASMALAAPASPPPTPKTVNCPSGQEHPVEYDGKTLDEQSCCPSPSSGQSPTGTQCFISKYLNPAINLLSASIGLVIIISIVIAGIQYSASAGDPNKAAEAKQRITNTLLGLAAFVFLYAFLQWVIPGGLLS